jgi:hypothetical protein
VSPGISISSRRRSVSERYYGLRAADAEPGAREIARRGGPYGFDRIAAEEQAREDKRLAMERRYRKILIDGPVLRIPLANMHFSFNPTNLFSLGDSGTVYPGMTVTDDWGRLEVDEAGVALMDKKFKTIHVGADGGGWKLELNPGWKEVPDKRKGDLVLVKM